MRREPGRVGWSRFVGWWLLEPFSRCLPHHRPDCSLVSLLVVELCRLRSDELGPGAAPVLILGMV